MGALKNCHKEMVLLSTHNICFGLEIKKIIFQCALLSLILRPNEVNTKRIEEFQMFISNNRAQILPNVKATAAALIIFKIILEAV